MGWGKRDIGSLQSKSIVCLTACPPAGFLGGLPVFMWGWLRVIAFECFVVGGGNGFKSPCFRCEASAAIRPPAHAFNKAPEFLNLAKLITKRRIKAAPARRARETWLALCERYLPAGNEPRSASPTSCTNGLSPRPRATPASNRPFMNSVSKAPLPCCSLDRAG